jgi:hypothetical protein
MRKVIVAACVTIQISIFVSFYSPRASELPIADAHMHAYEKSNAIFWAVFAFCALVFNVVTTLSISTIPFKAPVFTKTIASVAGVSISESDPQN